MSENENQHYKDGKAINPATAEECHKCPHFGGWGHIHTVFPEPHVHLTTCKNYPEKMTFAADKDGNIPCPIIKGVI